MATEAERVEMADVETADIACATEPMEMADIACATESMETAEASTETDKVQARGPYENIQVYCETECTAARKRSHTHMNLEQYISLCNAKRQRIPILVPQPEIEKEQNLKSMYKGRVEQATKDLEQAQKKHAEQMATERARHEAQVAELTAQHEAQVAELTAQHEAVLRNREATLSELHDRFEAELQAERAGGRKHVEDVKAWTHIQAVQAERQAKQQRELAQDAHERELAGRSKRVATWQAKRNNKARELSRTRAKAARAEAAASASAADARAAAEDNTALHAELGQSIKVAQQREHAGTRTAFTFGRRICDLKVRLQSLNSGASNVRPVTGIYSSSIAADGRDLELESGSRRSILRWEKTTDVVLMRLESRQLRNAMLEQPRTRLWASCDLSPDCRAIEQFGMMLEYAGATYVGADEDAPQPFGCERLTGEPLQASALVRFGPDGCPLVVEWTKRVFTPMLAALGPKYAATADCFMRTLQVYGSTTGEMLDPEFRFATVERLDVSVPLVDRMEGITADGGGEVHKSGGVIQTVVPHSAYRHCGGHGLNLSLEKSIAFENIGGSVRSISSFLRGGNKHSMLVQHMKCIQRPKLASDVCSAKLRAMYRDAHAEVRRHGQFHESLGGSTATPDDLRASIDALSEASDEELVLVADAMLEQKSKKGTDVRWRYECEVLDSRLLDIAHLLVPAILIEYGTGETYTELTIDEGTEKTPKNKTATAVLALLVDPFFIFWATYLRFIYTRVYKRAFDEVQANHHHAAPALAGPNGLPMQWARSLRAAIVQPARAKGKPKLCESTCTALVALLKRHPQLGGLSGESAMEAIADLEAQAQHLESYFARWRSLEGLVHALALEVVVQGPLTAAACELAEGRRSDETTTADAATAATAAARVREHAAPDEPSIEELQDLLTERRRLHEETGAARRTCTEGIQNIDYFDLLPRVPAAEALACAKQGIELFEAASADEREELPGTLAWLLFSPTTRDGADNPIFACVKAFAAGEENLHTRRAFPYRCWVELTQTLVAGGAKYCPSTSAMVEGFFNALTRQQGASKNNITQPQISYEARSVKNSTMEELTEHTLREEWADARALQAMFDTKGFWVCDAELAADRKLSQKLKEQREVELAADADAEEAEADDSSIGTYEAERIVSHEKDRKTGEYIYVVKWKSWESKHNTKEPESHLLTSSVLLTYWKGKIKGRKATVPQQAQVDRVTKLQDAALREKHEAQTRRRARPVQRDPDRPPATAAAAPANVQPASRPAAASDECRTAYDRAYRVLRDACCLVFDTETSGFVGSVLNIGWILADADGGVLVSYERLWRLPANERIDRRAFQAHGIDARRLAREGVAAKPEVGEFLALVAAAVAAGVRVVAHNASFDVARLNHTAIRQGLSPSLRSAVMLCTMHNATRHCGLRARGGKRLKAPRNEELFVFLFGRKPSDQLHSALPDCRVTLASYIEGRCRKWW